MMVDMPIKQKLFSLLLLLLLFPAISCGAEDEPMDIYTPVDGAIVTLTPIRVVGTAPIPLDNMSANGIPLVLSEKGNFDTGVPLTPGINIIRFSSKINGQETVITDIHITYIPGKP
jgi:hypothetical protein